MPTSAAFKQAFAERLDEPLQLARLFEELPDIYFFAKDLAGRFVLSNTATLRALGLRHEGDLIGRTDYDIVPHEIADEYRLADRRVMTTARPVRNVVEPVPNAAGVLNWFVTSKVPLFARDGQVAGVAVAMRDVRSMGAVLGPYAEMTRVIEHIHQHYAEPVEVATLAEKAGLSVRQFERRFKRLFHVPPLGYVNQHRVRAACVVLRESSASIADIALRVGFYDHSHFVRQFRKLKGITPTEYRRGTATPAT